MNALETRATLSEHTKPSVLSAARDAIRNITDSLTQSETGLTQFFRARTLPLLAALPLSGCFIVDGQPCLGTLEGCKDAIGGSEGGSDAESDDGADDTAGECADLDPESEEFTFRCAPTIEGEMCQHTSATTPMDYCKVRSWTSGQNQNVENKTLSILPNVESYEITPFIDEWVKQPGSGWTDKYVRLHNAGAYYDQDTAGASWTTEQTELWSWIFAQGDCEGTSVSIINDPGPVFNQLGNTEVHTLGTNQYILAKHQLPVGSSGVAETIEVSFDTPEDCLPVLWLHNMDPNSMEITLLHDGTVPDADPIGFLEGYDGNQFWTGAAASGYMIVQPSTP